MTTTKNYPDNMTALYARLFQYDFSVWKRMKKPD